MKRFKVREVIRLLKQDGWYLHDQAGSHRQFKDPSKKGKVTVKRQTWRQPGAKTSKLYLETSRLAISLLLGIIIDKKIKWKK